MLVILLDNHKDIFNQNGHDLTILENTYENISSNLLKKFSKIIFLIKSEGCMYQSKRDKKYNKMYLILFTNNFIDMINIIIHEYLKSDKFEYLNIINISDYASYTQDKLSNAINGLINKEINTNYIDYEYNLKENKENLKIMDYKVNYLKLDKNILNIVGGIDTYSNIQILIEKIYKEENDITIPVFNSCMINNINTALLYFIMKIKLIYEYSEILKLNQIFIKNDEILSKEIELNREKLNLNIFTRENKNKEIEDLFFVIKNNKNESDNIIYDDEIFMFMEMLKHRKYYYDCLTKIKKIIDLNINKEAFNNKKIKNSFISFFSTIFNNNLNINQLIYINECSVIYNFLYKYKGE